jgi:hypothetical protein
VRPSAVIVALLISISPLKAQGVDQKFAGVDQKFAACIYGIDDNATGPCWGRGAGSARFLCGGTVDSIAHRLCDIHTPTGVISVPFDRPVVINKGGGGECGVTWVDVTCHSPAAPVAVIQRPDVLPCGQPLEASGPLYCAADKNHAKNFTVYPRTQQSGGACGYTTVTILCYK